MERKKFGKIWTVSKNELIVFVSQSSSLADILRLIGFDSWSTNHYLTLKKRLKQENIDYSHIGNGKSNNGGLLKALTKEAALREVFVLNGTYHQRTIRDYLKRYSLLSESCECGQTSQWRGKPLTLQLDHINGNNKDNRIENLRWLCPNCHSQTPTFGVKNLVDRKANLK